MKNILRLLRLVKPYKKWMLLSILLGTLTVGSGIGLMMTSAFIIALAALHPSIAELHIAIAGVRFFGIARGVFRYLERLVTHETTFRLLSHFRVWFYRALVPLMPAVTTRFKSADLLQRIINDIQTLENFYVRVISPPVVALFTGVIVTVLFAQFHLIFATIFLLCYGLAALLIPFLGVQLSRGLGADLNRLSSALHIHLIDSLNGQAELKVNNQLKNQQQKIDQINLQLTRLQQRFQTLEALNQNLTTLFMFGAVVLTIIFAVPMIQQGMLNGVQLTVLVLGILAAFEGVMPLPQVTQFMEANLKAAERLFEIIDHPALVKDAPAAFTLPLKTPPSIVFEKVGFRYQEKESPVINEVSFSIPAGKKVAIVGPSGSGKSTLAFLLLRLWETSTGAILLDRVNIRDLRQDNLRTLIAYAGQRFHLFTGTVAENLRLINPDLTDDQMAEILDLVSLSKELEAERFIGEHGKQLSGGQAQRLGLAMALVKDAPILIMDEVTANLDLENERKILNAIFNAYENRTVINITHRLNGMELYDHIIVLLNGKIVCQGRHEELAGTCALYEHMLRVHQEQTLLHL